jgi:exopolysaccharide biosynthesis polyprenyl glycosylphosphotransferase
VAIGLAAFVVAAFLFRLWFVARTFVLLFGIVQWFALVIARVLIMQSVRFIRRQGVDGHRILVVGTGEQALGFARILGHQSPWRIEVVGYVSVGEDSPLADARPLAGTLAEIADILDRTAVDEVVFAVPDRGLGTFKEAMAACDARGVDVLFSLPSVVPRKGTLQVAEVSGFDYPVLNLRRTPTGEARLATKRVIDVVVSSVGLVLASPVLLAAVVAIKLGSPGPVFFQQVRAGRNGRRFKMYKFRSMVNDAEARRGELQHLNEMQGPVFKIAKDPRITRVGAFLRKTSIDELPQLFNVLWGQMSLVGPRPPLPDEVAQYKPWQRRRLSVKPGITGLWQVSGRNQVDFDEWMELDLRYIDNWSIWFDIEILLKTIPVVLLRKGAS